MICFDRATEKMERFEFAEVLVEIEPTKLLPNQIPIQLSLDYVTNVMVEYAWTSEFCEECNVFGYTKGSCEKNAVNRNLTSQQNEQQSKEI